MKKRLFCNILKTTFVINKTKTFMEIVKLLRKKLKVKQYVIANTLGLQQANYANIENGKLIPNNLDEIKEKALNELKPFLNQKIKETMKELGELTEYRLLNYKD